MHTTSFAGLGATNTLTVYDQLPTDLFANSQALIAAYDELLSFYDPDSLLSAINANAGVQPVAIPRREVFGLIAEAIAWSKRNAGFNALIGPLVSLWRIGEPDAQAPSEDAIQAALALTDPEQVQLDPGAQTVFLRQAGMQLDLGGIAKGFILDQLGKLWINAGVTGGLIDLAGNQLLVGNSPEHVPLWQVPIADPRDQDYPAIATLTTPPRAVVTTSIYFRYSTIDGVKYHHLLDPHTGKPVQSTMTSITVVANSATAADALSSIGFYAGVPAGLDLVEQEGGEAVFITTDTRLHQTAGLRERLVVTMGH